MDQLSWIVTHGADLLQAALAVVGAASVVAALTPTPKDDAALAVLRRVLDLVAQNYGHARNDQAAGGK